MRIAVTGAAGQIGYALVYRLAAGELGPGSVELRLLEVPGAIRALDGVAMELLDCAFPQLAAIEVTSDPRVAFDGANIAMLVGASPRKAGMERADMLGANAAIFAEQGRALTAAAPDIKVVVTGNPANTNALVASRHADGIPREHFTALTRLDHDRARTQLARRARRPVADVTNMTIWGNHSATQYADAFNARICGRPAAEWLADDAWIAFDFIPTVAKRGAAVIAARGKSSAASAANATIGHVRDWLHGTPAGDWTSMAVPSDGSYGVPPGLISSFPVRCAGGRCEIVPDLPLNAFSRSRLDISVAELRAEAAEAARMGLLPS